MVKNGEAFKGIWIGLYGMSENVDQSEDRIDLKLTRVSVQNYLPASPARRFY